MTLFEYQVRQAQAAGAGHIVILATRMPQEMMAGLDRLARDKIVPDIARTARDAADRIHPDERLIVITAGIFATPSTIKTIAGFATPVLLTRDAAGAQAFERIDGNTHWAGLALLDGAMLRETASLLGDWALAPTLLRIAVQRGIAREHLDQQATATVLSLETDADAVAANRFLATEPHGESGLVDKVYAPLARFALPPLMNRAGFIEPIALVPLVLLAGGLALGLFGWVNSGIALLCAAHAPAWLAERLATATSHRVRWLDFARPAFMLVASILCLLLAWRHFGLVGDRSILPLGLITAIQVHLRWDSAKPLDPVPAMGVILVASLAGWPDIGFLAVLLAGVLPAIWRRFQSRKTR
jgi:hypothetical protein